MISPPGLKKTKQQEFFFVSSSVRLLAYAITMILCLCLWRSLCRRLDFIPLFCLLFSPHAYAYAHVWTRLNDRLIAETVQLNNRGGLLSIASICFHMIGLLRVSSRLHIVQQISESMHIREYTSTRLLLYVVKDADRRWIVALSELFVASTIYLKGKQLVEENRRKHRFLVRRIFKERKRQGLYHTLFDHTSFFCTTEYFFPFFLHNRRCTVRLVTKKTLDIGIHFDRSVAELSFHMIALDRWDRKCFISAILGDRDCLWSPDRWKVFPYDRCQSRRIAGDHQRSWAIIWKRAFSIPAIVGDRNHLWSLDRWIAGKCFHMITDLQ